MKKKLNFCVLIFVFGFVLFLLPAIQNKSIIETNPNAIIRNEIKILPPNSATEHSPISIIGNSAFSSVVGLEGWEGLGTYSDPYIIENLTITTTTTGESAIKISNTQVYFIIRNCTLIASGASSGSNYPSGIWLSNVQNAIIYNNTAMYNTKYGFYLSSSSKNNTYYDNIAFNNTENGFHSSTSNNNTFFNNIAINNTKYGFNFFSSHNNTFYNNIAVNNTESGFLLSTSNYNILSNNIANSNGYTGFYLMTAKNNIYFNNTAKFNYAFGFFLYSLSNNNTFINNTAANHNTYYGFYIYTAHNNSFVGNNVSCNFNGFYIFSTNYNNTFEYNLISSNTRYGIQFSSGSGSNLVLYNTFSSNYPGHSQAYNSNSTNLFQNNYWVGHTTPDANSDGYVDTPYGIEGSSGYDLFPIADLNSPTLLPITPNPSTSGNLSLTWTAVSGAQTYCIYYSITSISNVVGLTPIATVTETTYQVNNSGVGPHYFVIKAFSATQSSPISNCINVIVVISTPPTLQNITPNPSSTGNISLTWNTVDGATSYCLYRSGSLISTIDGMTPIANITATTYQDLGISNGTYYYVVISVYGLEKSDLSNCINVTIAIPPINLNTKPSDNNQNSTDNNSNPNGGNSISSYDLWVLIPVCFAVLVFIKKFKIRNGNSDF